MKPDLIAWIGTAKRVPAVAEQLNENPRTVMSWFRKQRAPSLRAATKIIVATQGALDYNAIFGPFGPKRVDQ